MLWFLACAWIPEAEHLARRAQAIAGGEGADSASDSDGCEESSWYADKDGDGFGDLDAALLACLQPDGYVAAAGDCDDSDRDSAPGLTEVCGDRADNDCDGTSNGCHLDGAVEIDTSTAPRVTSDGPNCLWETSIAWIGDVNEDGNDDFVFSSVKAGAGDPAGSVFLVHGPLSGDSTASTAWNAEWTSAAADTRFGAVVAAVGDVDGDGLPDIAASDSAVSSVYLLSGAQTGSVTVDDAIGLRVGDIADGAGYALAGGGDLVGGADLDLVASSLERCTNNNEPGRAWVIPGPLASVDDFGGAISVTGENAGDTFGCESAVLDVNADGAADVVWGAGGIDAAYVFFGPIVGSSLDAGDADVRLVGDGGFGFELSGYGDGDADGYGNFVVSATYESAQATFGGAAFLFDGDDLVPGTNSSGVAHASIHGSSANARCCTASSGDLDGDGAADLVLGAPYLDNNVGGLFLFHGALSGTLDLMDADYTVGMATVSPPPLFGAPLAGGGDNEGDGYDDVLVLAKLQPPLGVLYVVNGTGQ